MTRRSAQSGDLFIDGSGQLRLVDKSVEQQALEKGKVECLGLTFDSEDARRAYFTEKLIENLPTRVPQDAGFPLGSDDDIIRMSDPPYHTACPDPFLADFLNFVSVKRCADDNNIPAFSDDILGSKHGSMYNVHPYHTKVPPEAIEPARS